jgi:exopolysaccharide biosynthesis polyprenyl glycosylphosphotransferase
MRRNLKRRQIGILIVDLALMYAALLLALLIRKGQWPSLAVITDHTRHFNLIFIGWIVVFYTSGMYRLELPFDDLAFVRRLGIGALVAGLGSAVYFYLLPDTVIEPKTVLVLYVVIYAALFWAWRFVYGRTRRRQRQRIGVGFIGFSDDAREMAEELKLRKSLGYDVRFAYDENPETRDDDLPLFHESFLIRHFVEDSDSDLLVIAGDRELSPELCRVLYGLLDRRVRFMRLPDFYELILRRVPIGTINETWFLENIDLKAKQSYEWVKRGIDIFLATFIFCISLPFWLFIAAAIKLGGPGPVFFKQARLGRFSKPFTMIKFRTMRVEGNDQSPTGRSDTRITAVGRFLRASRMDELPQMLNILHGDMSFIGPRPERPELAIELERAIPYYRQRHLIPPGLTGWDQVSGEYHSPSIVDTNKKLQYDLYYLKNLSLFLDLSIFFKTIVTVLMRAGR